ncbi:MAG: hypothetical protein K5644_00275 [Lachnospiraceae bacterium]|nr:hypothetical protein [Lachnospiraceae bacterium]
MSQQTVRRRPVNNANLEARRKAMRRKKIKEKKFMLLGMLLAVILVIVLIVWGIVSLVKSGFADTSTLTIAKDGTITMDEVEDFKESNYDESELEEDTETLADEYNESGMGGKAKFKKAKVKDGVAYLRMEYSDYNAYVGFTGNELFVGTVGEAKLKGYDFNDTFSSVSNKTKGDAISSEDMMADDSKKVVMIRGNVHVIVPGKVTAVSDSCTSIINDNEISITQPDGNKDATVLTIIMYE